MAHGGALQQRGLQRNLRALAHQPCSGAAMDRNSLYQHPGELREWKPFLPLGLKRHCKIDYTPKGPQNTDKNQDLGWERGGTREGAAVYFLGDCQRVFLEIPPVFQQVTCLLEGEEEQGLLLPTPFPSQVGACDRAPCSRG